MRTAFVAVTMAALFASVAMAQTDAPTLAPGPPNQAFTPPPQPFTPGSNAPLGSTQLPAGNPAAAAPAAPGAATGPAATEAGARSLLQSMGYNVTNLTQDASGTWHGVAQIGGRTVPVGVDPQGNVTRQ